MSYILDALKKSEAERSGSNSGEKTSLHKQAGLALPLAQKAGRGNNTTIAVALFLVIILIGLAAVLLYFQSLETNNIAGVSVIIEPVLNSSKPVLNSPKIVTEARLVLPSTPATVDAVTVTPAEDTPPSPSTPFATLERIPTLTITGHTYSTIKEKRQVVMNGDVWSEGAPIVDGVTLQEITQGGIILDVAGWPVVIGRSQGWKAIKGSD